MYIHAQWRKGKGLAQTQIKFYYPDFFFSSSKALSCIIFLTLFKTSKCQNVDSEFPRLFLVNLPPNNNNNNNNNYMYIALIPWDHGALQCKKGENEIIYISQAWNKKNDLIFPPVHHNRRYKSVLLKQDQSNLLIHPWVICFRASQRLSGCAKTL